jgi:hypothetical protein
MAIQPGQKKISNHVKEPSDHPGKIKIAGALSKRLEEKDFKSTIFAKLANTSGVDLALIYMLRPIFGVVEHLIPPGLIFERKIEDDACTGNLCQILLYGIFKDGTVK